MRTGGSVRKFSEFRVHGSGSAFRAHGFGFRVSGLELWVSRLVLTRRVYGLGKAVVRQLLAPLACNCTCDPRC